MKQPDKVTGVILAGGLGTRLRSLVPDKPKVIAEVGGRPFVTYLLDQLAEAGLRTIVLCTGYLADKVEDCLGDSYRGMALRYSREESPLGTGGAVRHALPMLGSGPSLVVNGDSFCAVDFAKLEEFHFDRGAAATLVLSRMDDARRFGRVETDHEGRITRFVEKGAVDGADWVNGGIYLIEPGFVESIPPGVPVSLEREVFPRWIGNGLYGLRGEGQLLDIGVPDSYQRANVEFQTHR